ncbi:molybdenum cofactor biosynthesis protein MoaE [Herbiconiux sp.]|uniref:molybdenum cofactor biosynthesis protein MoaE n=1 Tax=Herbiconiux sp. TaxID=1871186 RepID=UPI0025C611AE|nr:molybdenum cofactor biosynthesis protein MoaE [Herbiconiux sp.]
MPGPTDIGPSESPASASDSAARVRFARIEETPITVEECSAAVAGAADGAVVTFEGVVRDHDDGKGVTGLSYTAHPSAADRIRAAAESIAAAYPAVTVAVAHRIGELGIGDVALACAVASAHRAEAFAACAALVDEVKSTVPIWKEQAFTDGTSEWVASIG